VKVSELICYQINLNHREDRWAAAQENRVRYGYDESRFHRFPAILEKFGGLGCAKSHMLALANLYARAETEYIMILEDDFRFLSTQDDFENRLSEVAIRDYNWDVIVLNGTLVKFKSQKIKTFRHIFECHSGAGYLVKKDYAPKIIEVFLKSIEYLSVYKDVNDRNVKSFLHSKFAIDVLWKQLQWKDKWLIGDPSFGCTEPSHSDIENVLMDQSTITFKSS
jgi:hypothetical protein